jgi:hypothetical protein
VTAAMSQAEVELTCAALMHRAKQLRNESKSRFWTGPAYAGARKMLRELAADCERIARGLAALQPGTLIRITRSPGR